MISLAKNRKLLLLYFRYKDSPYYIGSLILVTVLIGVLLLWLMVIPQVNDFFTVNNEIKSTRERINTLKKNINYLTTLSTAQLENELNLVFDALPSEKDFAAIIEAVTFSAANTNVKLNDYSIVVGELATPSAQLKQYYSVDLVLNIEANRQSSKAFLAKIQEILPIAQVKSFSLTEENSTMKVSFFFKPFPKGTYAVTDPIGAIPAQQASLFNSLDRWQISNPTTDIPTGIVPPDTTIGTPL